MHLSHKVVYMETKFQGMLCNMLTFKSRGFSCIGGPEIHLNIQIDKLLRMYLII